MHKFLKTAGMGKVEYFCLSYTHLELVSAQFFSLLFCSAWEQARDVTRAILNPGFGPVNLCADVSSHSMHGAHHSAGTQPPASGTPRCPCSASCLLLLKLKLWTLSKIGLGLISAIYFFRGSYACRGISCDSPSNHHKFLHNYADDWIKKAYFY